MRALSLLLLLAPLASAQAPLASYDGGRAARDPCAQGWTRRGAEADDERLGAGPGESPAEPGWLLRDASAEGTLLYEAPLDAPTQRRLRRDGWTLTARARVLDGLGPGAAAVLQFGDESFLRWVVFLDEDAGGALVAQLVGDGHTQTLRLLARNDRALHTFGLHRAPGATAARFHFDGAPLGLPLEGRAPAGVRGVSWGCGSSPGQAPGR